MPQRPPTDSVVAQAESLQAAVGVYLRAARISDGSAMAGALQSMRARLERVESAHNAWVNACVALNPNPRP